MSVPQALPDPDAIRQTTIEILQGSEYQLDQQSGGGEAWIALLLDLVVWLFAPFRWLFDQMEGLPEPLRWLIVVGLFVILTVLILHITYSLITVFRAGTRKSGYPRTTIRRVPTPDELESLAQEALANRDFMAAVRYLFRAGLVHLQEIEGKVMRPGLTNRAYLRRYQGSPIAGSLQLFVDIIDSSWYGKGECREEDYQQCRAAYAQIRQHSKDNVHAHSA